MSLRTVKKIVTGQQSQMGASVFYQPLPVPGLDSVDPFLLLHHWGPNTYNSGEDVMNFDAHPHCGFEPVTFVFEGEVFHRDSTGEHSVIRDGGIQWMTAGKGIVHAEGPSEQFKKDPGTLEMIQLWINLPKKFKGVEPRYQGLQKSEIPSQHSEDGRVTVHAFSGLWNGIEGPVESITGIRSLTMKLEKGGELTLKAKPERASMIYILRGKLSINGSTAETHQLITFEHDGDELELKAGESTVLLYVEGDPINEPVVQHGPFVMNTQQEIYQAMRDYQEGKMGVLDD